MRFIKMHGIGNDYIYVNGFAQTIDDPARLAIALSDRHFGIGGDGLILVLPPTLPSPSLPSTFPESSQERFRAGEKSGQKEEGGADVRMRMFNADGSESEMCGNGVRCVCKFAVDQGLTRAKPLRVQTGRGVLTLDYELDAVGKVSMVSVEMGRPILVAQDVPVVLAGHDPKTPVIDFDSQSQLTAWGISQADQDRMAESGFDARMTCVSMGNPHVVFYVRDAKRFPLEAVGPIIEKAPAFPKRINVHVVQINRPDELTMRTWERGSGITLACGTGASAVCVAGVLTGRSDRRTLIHLPGGDLELAWPADDASVRMTGPATEVFRGEIDLK